MHGKRLINLYFSVPLHFHDLAIFRDHNRDGLCPHAGNDHLGHYVQAQLWKGTSALL